MERNAQVKERIRDLFRRQEYLVSGLIGIIVNPYYIIRNRLYQLIQQYSSYLSGHVLDFGCGSKPYRSLFTVESYLGVDIKLGESQPSHQGADVFYDGRHLPFEDKRFDSIFSSEVIEHIFNIDEIVAELFRVLKPGGFLVVTTPFVWGEHMKPYDYCRYTSYGIRELFYRNGFEVISVKKSGNFVETVFQMATVYFWQHFGSRMSLLKPFLQLMVIVPLNLVGIILGRILPPSQDFYLSLLLLAKKPDGTQMTS